MRFYISQMLQHVYNELALVVFLVWKAQSVALSDELVSQTPMAAISTKQ